MINKIKTIIKKNTEIFALSILILIAVISTNYYNYNKNKILKEYKNLINNIYLKKSVESLFNNLEPKFKKVNHKIKEGETFDNILKEYSVKDNEIKEIKNLLKKKFNLNKLNTSQKIKFTIDQTNNVVKDFTFQISNTEKIYLARNDETDEFNQKILLTKLSKKIIYKENSITDSLYRSAVKQKIPANIIIEFARIYGFQVDFQRDIRKNDSFQIMFEVFVDENKKIIESGEILFANLNLSGETNALYYFDKKEVRDIKIKMARVLKSINETPINGARLSSPFGMRKHPIDGFNKMIEDDFAAPMGTPELLKKLDGVEEAVLRQ